MDESQCRRLALPDVVVLCAVDDAAAAAATACFTTAKANAALGIDLDPMRVADKNDVQSLSQPHRRDESQTTPTAHESLQTTASNVIVRNGMMLSQHGITQSPNGGVQYTVFKRNPPPIVA